MDFPILKEMLYSIEMGDRLQVMHVLERAREHKNDMTNIWLPDVTSKFFFARRAL